MEFLTPNRQMIQVVANYLHSLKQKYQVLAIAANPSRNFWES